MELALFDILIIVAYFLVVILIGLWARKNETSSEYLIGDRKIGTWQTSASIMAVVGGMLLVAQATLAFDFGFAAMWFWVGFSLGFIFLGLSAKKIKSIADKHRFLTISDYLFINIGNKSGVLGATIIFIAFFSLLTGQFIAGASIFSPLLGISYSMAVMLLGVGTLIYLYFGGFKAVIKTDLLQFLIMFVVFMVLLFNINVGSFTTEQLDMGSLGGFTTLIFLLMGTFVIFGSADIWQRLIASKDVQTVQKASFISAILFFTFGISLSMVGIAAKNNFPNIDSGEALYYGFTQLVPEPLFGVAIIVILAAIMSTIDTELFVLSTSIAKDFHFRRKARSDSEMAKIIRTYLIVLAFLSMSIAIYISEILLVLFGIVSLILSVSPAIIASLFWKMKDDAVFMSMIAGIISLFILVITGNFSPDNSIITLPTSILFLFIGQVLFKK